MTGFKSKREAAQAGSVTKNEALKMALEALEFDGFTPEDQTHLAHTTKAITAIKEALAQPEPAGMLHIDRLGKWLDASLKEREQPEQEPVAWMNKHGACISAVFKKVEETAGEYTVPLYTTPPKREWVGLTDEEIEQGCKESWVTEQAWQSAVWWAEAKLKVKNYGRKT